MMTSKRDFSKDHNINADNPFLNIAPEILLMIFDYLPPHTLCLLALACKDTNIISSHNLLWSKFYKQLPADTFFKPEQDYKKLYLARKNGNDFAALFAQFILEYEKLTPSAEQSNFIKIFKILNENIHGKRVSAFIGAMSLELERVTKINPDYHTNMASCILNKYLYDKLIQPLNIRQVDSYHDYVEALQEISETKYTEQQLVKASVIQDVKRAVELQKVNYDETQLDDYYYRVFYNS